MKILLVEDCEVDAAIFSRLALARGHSVIWSESATSGYGSLQIGKYDVAVIDYNLTDSSGQEVAAFVACWIKRVCFLTGEPTLVSQTFPVFSKTGMSDALHPLWKWIPEC